MGFELGKEVEKDVFFPSCHERGTKKYFLFPMRNRTSDLRIPRSDASHNTIDITNPSSMLSGRASRRGIRRSEVRFLMGPQNFLFVPRL